MQEQESVSRVSQFATNQSTVINEFGIIFIVIACILILILPRRYACFPVIAAISFMTLGQRILFFDLDFTLLRILILFGWLRIAIRLEMNFKWQLIDKLMVAYGLVSFVAYAILWQTGSAAIYKLGTLYNLLGSYFMFRCFIRDYEETIRVIRMLLLCLVPLAVLMMVERVSGRNPFAFLGGVPLFTLIREGRLRCQGPFGHPILAGTFAATLAPLALVVWLNKSRVQGVLGFLSASLITFLAASSGPAFAWIAGTACLCLWPLRGRMRAIRWGILLTLTALHLVMKVPVWFLLGRIAVFGGSTGWHRAYLIDQTVRHFGQWWIVGIRDTGEWAPQLADVTNQFVVVAAEGGLITLIVFAWIISLCFARVGLVVHAAERENRPLAIGAWAIGCSLMAHIASFISVSYFDQNIVNWSILLAIIIAIQHKLTEAPVGKHQARPAFTRLSHKKKPASAHL